ncbi:prepilin cleavage protein [Paraglaciecola aestuariivivens]
MLNIKPKRKLSYRYQSGASLIELMIAMALGIAALSAIASLVGYGIGVNGKLLSNSRLNEEINSIGALITRDIKRAGFNADTINMVSSPADFPSAFRNSVVVSEHPDEDEDSCLLYAYDQNANGVLDTVANNENFGFRLRNGTVEIRTNGATCASETWQALTDPKIVTITELSFDTELVTFNNIVSTQITLELEGELVANDNLSRLFTSRFLVRNYD